MFCRSSLLGALLPSGPLLVPPLEASTFLVFFLNAVRHFWRSCSSKTWSCLVRRFTAVVSVCTCLSKAVRRGLSPWTLLVVDAIERVRTMQLLIQEAFVVAYKFRVFPQTVPIDDAVNIISKLHDPNARKSHLCNKKKRPNREHRCGAGWIPSEDQVRTILTTLEC